MTDDRDRLQSEIDFTVAHPARVYDFLLGGKDNYAADRVVAREMTERLPALPMMIRANRDFLGRAVTVLCSDLQLRQFLDIGAGIPTANNVHEVAQRIDPTARVVYVDNDPIVLAHARALLLSTPEGRTAFVPGDARKPEDILANDSVFSTLDRTQPIALMLVSVLMYFGDDEAHHIVSTLVEALPSGSYVTLSHPTDDFNSGMSSDEAVAAARRGGITYTNRSEAEVTRFFAGLELVEPGVVPMLEWRPAAAHPAPRDVYYWVGMARKP